jgi:hypothetical protein
LAQCRFCVDVNFDVHVLMDGCFKHHK